MASAAARSLSAIASDLLAAHPGAEFDPQKIAATGVYALGNGLAGIFSAATSRRRQSLPPRQLYRQPNHHARMLLGNDQPAAPAEP